MTAPKVLWRSRGAAAWLTFESSAFLVTCSASLKFLDQGSGMLGQWTAQVVKEAAVWLKGHTVSLSNSYYASLSRCVLSLWVMQLPTSLFSKSQIHCSPVIISQIKKKNGYHQKMIQRYPFIFLLFEAFFSFHVTVTLFFCVALNVTDVIHSEKPWSQGFLYRSIENWTSVIMSYYVFSMKCLCTQKG